MTSVFNAESGQRRLAEWDADCTRASKLIKQATFRVALAIQADDWISTVAVKCRSSVAKRYVLSIPCRPGFGGEGEGGGGRSGFHF